MRSIRAPLMAILLFALLLAPSRVLAYRAATTHAGMTERAALASDLHGWLKEIHRLDQGLFGELALSPAVMGRVERWLLLANLRRLDPIHGYAPSSKLTNRALGWLSSGSVLESIPSCRNRHHFLEHTTHQGLHQRAGRFMLSFNMRVLDFLRGDGTMAGVWTGANFDLTGRSAASWANHPSNSYSLDRLWSHRLKAITERSPASRLHHLILSLVAAGAVSHLLQDMASPSHVRNDFVHAHLQNGAPGGGSRYEAFVDRKYGRFGIPAPKGPKIRRPIFQSFFFDRQGNGLAQRTGRRFFSEGTLPGSVDLKLLRSRKAIDRALLRKLSYPLPRPAALDMKEAFRGGAYLPEQSRSEDRLSRLAAYAVNRSGRLSFWLDRRCHEQYGEVLVAEAVSYTEGLLAYLLRGKLELRRTGNIVTVTNKGVGLHYGRLYLVLEDKHRRRRILKEMDWTRPVAADKEMISITLQSTRDAASVYAVFFGGDVYSGRVVAEGALPL